MNSGAIQALAAAQAAQRMQNVQNQNALQAQQLAGAQRVQMNPAQAQGMQQQLVAANRGYQQQGTQHQLVQAQNHFVSPPQLREPATPHPIDQGANPGGGFDQLGKVIGHSWRYQGPGTRAFGVQRPRQYRVSGGPVLRQGYSPGTGIASGSA
jgi:hypothetical protein